MRDAKDHVTTIACSLDRAQVADRRCLWEALARVALKELRPTAEGVELVYALSDEVERVLHKLAGLEAKCCSFAACA